ncbi:MAG: peptidoglycan DD-metalloendopeptidase family protein [Pseudomonadota bacterium]
MTIMRRAMTAMSVLLLGACGTHQSVAPVVYGTDPAASGRIYNAPQKQANVLSEPAPSRQPTYVAPEPAASPIEPVELQPVSAIYLSDEERAKSAITHRKEAAPQVSNTRMVTVGRGDTVYALSRRYGAEPAAIIAANNLRAPYHLSVGQRVRIPTSAPVARVTPTVASAEPAAPRDTYYRVRQGDTLYSVSRATGVSTAVLAQANGLTPPYVISPGQELLAPGATASDPVRMATNQPASAPARAPTQNAAAPATASPSDVAELTRQVSFAPSARDALFAWPVRGAIISNYGIGELGRRNDGINIAAPAGTPVRAAADGEVVYRGSELDGFGNLLLVKHTDGFVTAYAHNDGMLVKKGDVVRKGQVIAKVGQTGAVETPQLHFEIRQKLKSVDPIALLEKQ